MCNETLYLLLTDAASAANLEQKLSWGLYLSFSATPRRVWRQKKLRRECGGFWDGHRRSGAVWHALCLVFDMSSGRWPSSKEESDARALFLAGIEFDGRAYCAARNRRRFRAPVGVARKRRAAQTGIPRRQPRSQSADLADRRPDADRSCGNTLLSRQALSRGRALAVWWARRKSAGDLLDVLYRLDGPPGAAHWPRAMARSIQDRRAPPGRPGMDRRALFDRRHSSVPALLALCRCAEAE